MMRIALLLFAFAAAYVPFSQLLRAYLLFTGMSVYLLAVHAGAVPLFFALRPSRRQVIFFAAAVSVLCLVQGLVPAEPFQGPQSAMKMLALSAGAVALFQLAVAAGRARGKQRGWAREALTAICVMHIVVLVSRLVLGLLSNALPMTFDRHLYAMDAAFGVQISFALGRLFSAAPWFAAGCHLVYVALPFAVLFLFSRLQENRRSRWLLLVQFALIGIVGRLCYSAVPAMGPIYQFPDLFPQTPPVWSTLAVEAVRLTDGARNAMPSLHIVWALMLFWWTRGQALWLRAAASLFLFFTLLATLGLGEHYVVDLIVAVPFSLAVAPVFAAVNREGRWNPGASATGAGLVALWFVLIRTCITVLLAQPWLILVLSVLTLAIPLVFFRTYLAAGAGTGSGTPVKLGSEEPFEPCADVAELADALDLGSSARKGV
jgi:hypothetical protein